MRNAGFRWIVIPATLFWILSGAGFSLAQVKPGQKAPTFALKDLKGRTHDLARVKDRPLTVLYFFDGESRPSQEGLISLNGIFALHKGSGLSVWAITNTPRAKVEGFAKASGLLFPVLLDASDVGVLYKARAILPTVVVVGPGLKVLDLFQGGGKTTETMLVRVAERSLQRKETRLAMAIGDAVLRKDPKNAKAKAVKGYAALKEQKVKEAESVFKDLSGRKGGEGEVLGKEGLAAVYARMKEPDKALALAKEVERLAPDRSYAHVIRGDILYAMDRKADAEAEYRKAVEKKTAEPYQDGVRYNKLGRFYASAGQYRKAEELYEKAVSIDPLYIEGTTNKGFAYEKEGRWDKALEAYRQALLLDRNDAVAVTLARRAQEMLEFQKDAERKRRIDSLVKDLAARFREQQAAGKKVEDAWTSGPTVLSFVDFQDKGGLSERDGISAVMTAQLADRLNASGRVKVVERVLIDRLLEELNLGSSALADPETQLKLGRVLAARLVGTGSLFHLPQESLLTMRLVDTETSAIAQVTTRQLGPSASLEKETFGLTREILKTVIAKYPLQGFVVKAQGDGYLVNIGSREGVVPGTKFDVLEEGEAIPFKGKTLRGAPKSVAVVEAARVEPGFSVVKVVRQDRSLKAEDRIRERLEETAPR